MYLKRISSEIHYFMCKVLKCIQLGIYEIKQNSKISTSWGAGEMAQQLSTGCPSAGPGLDSRCSHNDTQPSVTLVPKDVMPSSASAHTRHACSTQTHTKDKILCPERVDFELHK